MASPLPPPCALWSPPTRVLCALRNGPLCSKRDHSLLGHRDLLSLVSRAPPGRSLPGGRNWTTCLIWQAAADSVLATTRVDILMRRKRVRAAVAAALRATPAFMGLPKKHIDVVSVAGGPSRTVFGNPFLPWVASYGSHSPPMEATCLLWQPLASSGSHLPPMEATCLLWNPLASYGSHLPPMETTCLLWQPLASFGSHLPLLAGTERHVSRYENVYREGATSRAFYVLVEGRRVSWNRIGHPQAEIGASGTPLPASFIRDPG